MEFLDSAATTPGLQAELAAATKDLPPAEIAGAIATVAARHGCHLSSDDIALMNQRMLGLPVQLSDASLDGVSGGGALEDLMASFDKSFADYMNVLNNTGSVGRGPGSAQPA
ncbi:hypothetical protein [Azorhizobium oxalatiphilum]|uniref:hypothetical protein n=1 Tax=Azorhizobium oxalatiphilum TaxID=980631 RepID=UPI001669CACC|nr:hypothetical protein [Azorhizobium oxalatiphilum]